MSEELQYNFCPVCGSVLENGKCKQCGYEMPAVAGKKDIYGQTYYNSPVPKNDGKGLCAFLAAFSALCIFLFAMIIQVSYRTIFNKIPDASEFVVSNSSNTKYDGPLSYYFKLYRSSLDDGTETVAEDKDYLHPESQYYVFDDYVDSSNGYKTVWRSWSYANQDGWFDGAGGDFPKDLYVYCEYPNFEDTVFDAEDLNYYLYYYSADIADLYEQINYSCKENEAIYLQGTTYLAYMDENVASLLYYYTAYVVSNPFTDEEAYADAMTVIKSVNINMTTGQILDARDIFDFNNSFVQTLKSECESQNEGANISEYYTDEEILDMCKNNEIIWIYTPLGMEFGVNYPNGYGFCTFTCFDRNKFKK